MDIEFVSQKSFKKNKKVRYAQDLEPHEALLDRLAERKEEEIGISSRKFEVPLSQRTLQGFLIISVLLFVFLFAKTFQMQVIEGKHYQALAQENKFIISQLQAERGIIYDRNGQPLVYNIPSFDLIANKLNLPESEMEKSASVRKAAEILGKTESDIMGLIEKARENTVTISQNISQENLIVLETKIKDLPGFEIKQSWKREYPQGEYFSHVMGYLGQITSDELKNTTDYMVSDLIGRAGLEKSYESTLKKDSGKLQIERDASGKEISRTVLETPKSGDNLVLWLDAGLQKKITDELKTTLERVGAKSAAVIAMDPKTGGIISLVSYPSFDNNLFTKGADQKALISLLSDNINKPLNNLAIAGRYLTGSTIKPFIAAAALEEKTISPDKKIYDSGEITIPNKYNPEQVSRLTGIKPHGWVNMREALAVSSNIYFYTVGGGYQDQAGLGPTRIKNYLDLFGWEEKTGIDLPGETVGFVPDKEWKKKTFPTDPAWWDGDTYNMSIGQGYLQITPLEVANAYAAIANGGTLYEPHIVQKVVDNASQTLEEIQPKIIRSNLIDAANLQVIREGMRLGVTGVNTPDALATMLNSLPVTAAAKTGTAQLGNDYNNNWISVFAPYDDPQIVLTVVIQNVKGLQGATVPLANEILQWYFGGRQ
jgi:penicillin-binding protein 2